MKPLLHNKNLRGFSCSTQLLQPVLNPNPGGFLVGIVGSNSLLNIGSHPLELSFVRHGVLLCNDVVVTRLKDEQFIWLALA
jgi:hypothetical protein